MVKAKARKTKTFVELSPKDSELRYRRLFETAQDGILILDAKTGAITDVNPFLIKMLGISRDEFVNKKLWEVGAFLDLEASKLAFKALQKDKYIRFEDLPLKAKDGHLVQVEFVSNVYLIGDQKVIQCNIRDITARKHAEAARRNSESQMRALVTSLDDIIIEMDEHGTYLNIWCADESMLVKPKVEMLGRQALEILGLELGGKILEACLRVLSSGRPEEIEYPLEVVGGARWFLARLSAIPTADGPAKTASVLVRDITENKRAAEQLHAEQDLFRKDFQISPIVNVLTKLPERTIVDVNQAFERLFGYERAEVIGGSIAQFDFWADPEERDRMAKVLLQKGEVHDYEFRFKTKSGSIGDGIFYSAISDQVEGKYAITKVLDITERKQAEKKLKRWMLIFEHAQWGVAVSSADGERMEMMNPAFAQMYGYTVEELTGKPIPTVFAPEALAELPGIKARVMEHGHDTFESLNIRKDGTIFPVLLDVTAVKEPDGKFAYRIVFSQDITERKQVEEALALERNLLGTLLDNLPDHIYFKDRNGCFTRISRSQAKAFGLSDPAEALGKTDFDFFTEMHAHPALEAEQKIMATGQPMVGLEEKETWPDGRLNWVNTSKMPLQDKAGNIIGTFGISSDITERKRVEQALIKSEAQLREQSVRDHLTGLFNRRYMEETLERELLRASRSHGCVGIMMLDMDNFKGFNDTYGHAAGDKVLSELGKFLLRHLRGEDIPCRYGGDEFILVLPDASRDVTRQRAELLCGQIRHLDIQFDGKLLKAVTLSAGIAAFPEDGSTTVEVLKAADVALYQAKEGKKGNASLAG